MGCIFLDLLRFIKDQSLPYLSFLILLNGFVLVISELSYIGEFGLQQ